MKKQIAICMALTALVGLLAGCGNKVAVPAETTATTTPTIADTTPTTEPVIASEPIGTLYVSFGAGLVIDYDADGNALSLTGTNEIGKQLAEAKQDQLNKGCVFTLRSILRMAISDDMLGDAKTMTVRIGADDPLPTEDFLFTIGQDCQYLIDEEIAGVDIYSLTGDMLDENGNLTYATAQMLASKYLQDEATGDETLANGVYTFTAGDMTCTVDAFTGMVIGQ